jgi:hypothetical protein
MAENHHKLQATGERKSEARLGTQEQLQKI